VVLVPVVVLALIVVLDSPSVPAPV
jgi:hypothetical protein